MIVCAEMFGASFVRHTKRNFSIMILLGTRRLLHSPLLPEWTECYRKKNVLLSKLSDWGFSRGYRFDSSETMFQNQSNLHWRLCSYLSYISVSAIVFFAQLRSCIIRWNFHDCPNNICWNRSVDTAMDIDDGNWIMRLTAISHKFGFDRCKSRSQNAPELAESWSDNSTWAGLDMNRCQI